MVFLEVKDLNVTYRGRGGENHAVKDVSFTVERGEVVSLVGESGSGKSTVGMAVGRLLDFVPCRVTGSVVLSGSDVFGLDDGAIRRLRRSQVAYVFQEPAVSLNPVFTAGSQIEEIWERPDEARVRRHLGEVQLREPERVARAYPHELSGGMKQRVMIAMALAKEPQLLIADEPTTALDATVQKEILKLLYELKTNRGMTLLYITHDLNVAAALSDRILVMKDGRIAEEIRDVGKLEPEHPYSKKLFRCSVIRQEPKTSLDV